jgi:hypothetical protein
MDALQHVESLAEAHYGYSQLLDICDFLGDKQRLYAHMRNLSGDMHSGVGSMITFVFTRCNTQQCAASPFCPSSMP